MSNQSVNNIQNNNLMTRREAATFLGIKEQTLACWAHNGRYNLPYYKIGRKVKYKLEDLEHFVCANQLGIAEK